MNQGLENQVDINMSKESNAECAESGADGGLVDQRCNVPSPVRRRTLRHLRQLLARTAAGGAALHLTTGAVCDPPPPPPDCETELTTDYVSRWAGWQAGWVQEDDEPGIEMTLSLWALELTFSGEPMLEGATLLESEVLENELKFTIAPLEGADTVTVSAPIKCEEEESALRLVLDVSGPPQPGEAVPITVAE